MLFPSIHAAHALRVTTDSMVRLQSGVNENGELCDFIPASESGTCSSGDGSFSLGHQIIRSSTCQTTLLISHHSDYHLRIKDQKMLRRLSTHTGNYKFSGGLRTL